MRRSHPLIVLAVVGVAVTACSRRREPPPAQPTPSPAPSQPARDTMAERLERERLAREDSIRRAREREDAARANATAENARLRAALQEMVFFDYDQFTIRDDARATLDRKVPILRVNSNVSLRIEGHADERGSVEYNLALSLRRANAIRDYLTNFGIPASRLEVVGLGEERPLDSGSTEDAFQRNRRGEFQLTRGGDVLTPPR
jgi:peptidoglycan-associated lipoprotein